MVYLLHIPFSACGNLCFRYISSWSWKWISSSWVHNAYQETEHIYQVDLVGINNRKLKSLNLDLQLISGTQTFSHLRAECWETQTHKKKTKIRESNDPKVEETKSRARQSWETIEVWREPLLPRDSFSLPQSLSARVLSLRLRKFCPKHQWTLKS